MNAVRHEPSPRSAGESCATSPSTCSTTGVTCDGDNLVLCVLGGDGFTFGDPIVADCTVLGSACQSDGSNGACVGPAGALCSVEGFVAQCDAGLTCTPDAANPTTGTCG